VVHPWHTLRYIKEAFKNRFGVHAVFFRKEKEEWIEVSGKDSFTLEEQNEIGRKIVDKSDRRFGRERELLL
jgi:hypothetical protein